MNRLIGSTVIIKPNVVLITRSSPSSYLSSHVMFRESTWSTHPSPLPSSCLWPNRRENAASVAANVPDAFRHQAGRYARYAVSCLKPVSFTQPPLSKKQVPNAVPQRPCPVYMVEPEVVILPLYKG
jgi:hypothetical protein